MSPPWLTSLSPFLTKAERHGASEDDLLAFADVHGGDYEYMTSVWAEIQTRLDAVAFAEEGEDLDEERDERSP